MFKIPWKELGKGGGFSVLREQADSFSGMNCFVRGLALDSLRCTAIGRVQHVRIITACISFYDCHFRLLSILAGADPDAPYASDRTAFSTLREGFILVVTVLLPEFNFFPKFSCLAIRDLAVSLSLALASGQLLGSEVLAVALIAVAVLNHRVFGDIEARPS